MEVAIGLARSHEACGDPGGQLYREHRIYLFAALGLCSTVQEMFPLLEPESKVQNNLDSLGQHFVCENPTLTGPKPCFLQYEADCGCRAGMHA